MNRWGWKLEFSLPFIFNGMVSFRISSIVSVHDGFDFHRLINDVISKNWCRRSLFYIHYVLFCCFDSGCFLNHIKLHTLYFCIVNLFYNAPTMTIQFQFFCFALPFYLFSYLHSLRNTRMKELLEFSTWFISWHKLTWINNKQ